MIALLPLACFGEPPDPGGGNDTTEASTDPTDADTGTSPTDPSTASVSSTSPGTSASTSATSNTTTTDSGPDATSATTIEPETDSDAPPCGEMGQACCEGSACDEGACLLGTCVAFAGVFINGDECRECPSVLQALSCGCPDGFEIAPALPLLSSGCIKDAPEPWNDDGMYMCQAIDYVPGVSDWGGAYVRADPSGDGCGDAPECIVGNPYTTGECDCPPESTAVEVVVFGHCDGDIPDPPPAFRLGLCMGNAEPLTLGGVVYSEGPTCIAPHPVTGNCDCPPELTRTSLRVISQAVPNMAGDLGFCVRAP